MGVGGGVFPGKDSGWRRQGGEVGTGWLVGNDQGGQMDEQSGALRKWRVEWEGRNRYFVLNVC